MPEQIAAGIEHIDEATTRAMNIILSFGILLGIGHKNFAIEIADAEWSITCRKVGIDEAVGIHLMKIFIEGVDVTRMEICRIQEIVTVSDPERRAFVDGAVNTMVRAVIDGDDGVCLIQRLVPAGNGTIFTDEDEPSWRRGPIFRHLEELRVVEHLSSGISYSSIPRGSGNLHYQRNGCAV